MTISPQITMRELLEQCPGAQRTLFRHYHIGGCASCGFQRAAVAFNANVADIKEHTMRS
jgi:hypothetical protein